MKYIIFINKVFKYNNMIKYLGEFIGTFILVLVIIYLKKWYLIGLTLGLLILIGHNIYITSFNPAISVAHYAHGLINLKDLILYITMEISGALLAVYSYNYFYKNNKK
jgi:glycerol uptake facilitator-like aquaporin